MDSHKYQMQRAEESFKRLAKEERDEIWKLEGKTIPEMKTYQYRDTRNEEDEYTPPESQNEAYYLSQFN